MTAPNGVAAAALEDTNTKTNTMDGSLSDKTIVENTKIVRKSLETAPINELSCIHENGANTKPPGLPNDAFLQRMVQKTPESTKSWHKELLFGLFLHSDNAELSRLAEMAGSSITRQLPLTRHELDKSSSESMDVDDTVGKDMMNPVVSDETERTARKRSRTELEWNDEASREGRPSRLSLIPQVLLQEQSRWAETQSSTASFPRRSLKRQHRPVSLENLQELERVVQEKFLNSSLGKQATSNQNGQRRTPSFEPFSLEYNECSMSGIAAWALQSESPPETTTTTTLQVPAPAVMFRQCGCCHKWGHYETDCKELVAKDTVELARQVKSQQMQQESFGTKPAAPSFLNLGPSNQPHVTCDVCQTTSSNHGFLYCHLCSRSFHPKCLECPVSASTDDVWQCQECEDEVQSQVSSTVDVEGCDGFVIEQCKQKAPSADKDGNKMSVDNDVVEWAFPRHGWTSAVGIQSHIRDEHKSDVEDEAPRVGGISNTTTTENLLPGDLCWTRYKGEDRNPMSERDNWWPSIVISVDNRQKGKPSYVVKLFTTLLSRVKTSVALPFLQYFERLGYDRVNGDESFDRFRDDSDTFARALDAALSEIGCISLAYALKKAQQACGTTCKASIGDENLLEVEETWDDAEDAVQAGFLIRAKRDPVIDHAESIRAPEGRLAGSVVACFPNACGVEIDGSSPNSMLVGIVLAANLGDETALVQLIPDWKTLLATRDDSFVVKSFSVGATTWFKMRDLHLISSGAPVAVRSKSSADLLPKRLHDERERLRASYVDSRASNNVDRERKFTASLNGMAEMPASTANGGHGSLVNGAVSRIISLSNGVTKKSSSTEDQGVNSMLTSETVDLIMEESNSDDAAASPNGRLPASQSPTSDSSSSPYSSRGVQNKRQLNQLAWRRINMEDRPSKDWMRLLLWQVEGNSDYAQNDKAIRTRFKYRLHPNDVRFCADTNEWKLVNEARIATEPIKKKSPSNSETDSVVSSPKPSNSSVGRPTTGDEPVSAGTIATDYSDPFHLPSQSQRQQNEKAWRTIYPLPSVASMSILLGLTGLFNDDGLSQTEKAIITRFKRHFHPSRIKYCQETDEWNLVGAQKNGTVENGAPEITGALLASDNKHVVVKKTGEVASGRVNEKAWQRVLVTDIPSTKWMSYMLKQCFADEDVYSQSDTAIRTRFKRKIPPGDVLRCDQTNEWKLNPNSVLLRTDAEVADRSVPNHTFRPLRHAKFRDEEPAVLENTPASPRPKVANADAVDLTLSPSERAKLRKQREKPRAYHDTIASPEPGYLVASLPQETSPVSPPSLGVFQVEDILDDRQVTSASGAKRTEYLIKWMGYEMKDCTWERKNNILDPWLVERYQVRKACNKLATLSDENEDDPTFQLVLGALRVGKEKMDRYVKGSNHVVADRITCPFCLKSCTAKNPTPFTLHMNTHSSARNFELLKEAAQVIREEWYNGLA